MGIKAKGYQSWDGELLKRKISWSPIFRQGIVSVFRKKRAKFLYMFASFPFLIFVGVVYVLTKPELKIFAEFIKQYGSDAKMFSMFYTNGFLIFIMLLLCIHSGANQISNDIRDNSVALYFARPISKLDYILGKLSIVLFYIGAFTLAPGLLLILLKMIFTGSLEIDFQVLAAAVVFPVVIGLFFASMTLALSSLTRSGKIVTVEIFVLYFATDIIHNILMAFFKTDYLTLLSIRQNIDQFGKTLFGAASKADVLTLGWCSGGMLVGLTGIFLSILFLRVRRLEG